LYYFASLKSYLCVADVPLPNTLLLLLRPKAFSFIITSPHPIPPQREPSAPLALDVGFVVVEVVVAPIRAEGSEALTAI